MFNKKNVYFYSINEHNQRNTGMKKIYFSIALSFCFSLTTTAQSEIWNFQNYAIGNLASGSAYTSNAGMPDVIQIGSVYYMYFGYGTPGNNEIKYATSTDLINWAVQGTVLTGSSNPAHREYHMGGPRVVKLSGGQYRMFYRACESYTSSPPYHCLSAISNDGINFTKEGIRIEIKPHLPNSYFKRVAHSAFYKDAGGNMRAVLTGFDTTMTSGPDRLYAAFSPDEGLTWTNFTPIFSNGHDPVVAKDGSGMYHLYFSYLNTGFRKVSSIDGVGWISTPDTVYFKQGSMSLTESSSPNSIADLGAVTNSIGNVILFSAYKTVLGPWTNIAFYHKQVSSVADTFADTNNTILVFPNPFSTSITIQSNAFLHNVNIELKNVVGQTIRKMENMSGQSLTIMRENLPLGIYFLQITKKKQIILLEKVVVNE